MFLYESTEINPIDEIPLVEASNNGYVPGIDGALTIVSETIAEWGKISEAALKLDFKELKAISENSEELAALQENAVNDFLVVAKTFVTNLWKKVTELFAKFKAIVLKYLDAEQRYYAMHKKTIDAAAKETKLSGYEYSIDKLSASQASGAMIVEINKMADEETEKIKSQLYKVATGEEVKDGAELMSVIKSKLRSGATEKKDITVATSDVIGSITKRDAIKEIDAAKASSDKVFKERLSELQQNMNEKFDDATKAKLKKKWDLTKDALNICTMISGQQIEAIKERSSMFYSILRKLAGGVKDEKQQASAAAGTDDGTGRKNLFEAEMA